MSAKPFTIVWDWPPQAKKWKGLSTHNYFTATAKQHDIEAVYRQKEIWYPNIYEDENKTHTLVEATKPQPIHEFFKPWT